MSKPFEKETYYAIALDPIHIGTGGYRLGRVDMSITREPGTNLPKIPGTSLSGVARAYTALATDKYRQGEKSCAGKGGGEGEDHCGENGCPVCVTYGFSHGKSKTSFQGLAQFFDARMLFFPVHSMKGPVWVACPSLLSDFIKSLKGNGKTPAIETDLKLGNIDEELQTDLVAQGNPLNLGWLLLTNKVGTSPVRGTLSGLPEEILQRLVLVSDRLFSHIVNDNLEVRTSVAIDPATGAAESGALYSYEAMPRATVLWFEVIFNQPEHFRIRKEQIVKEDKKTPADWTWVKANVEKGLGLMQYLGVGGMGTRGMGRLKVLNLQKDEAGIPTEKSAAGGGK